MAPGKTVVVLTSTWSGNTDPGTTDLVILDEKHLGSRRTDRSNGNTRQHSGNGQLHGPRIRRRRHHNGLHCDIESRRHQGQRLYKPDKYQQTQDGDNVKYPSLPGSSGLKKFMKEKPLENAKRKFLR